MSSTWAQRNPQAATDYHREWYRRKHGVHPSNYVVGRRRMCRECWDELTDESAAPHLYTGRPTSWCVTCYPKHLRRLWRGQKRAWRRRSRAQRGRAARAA